MLLSGAAAYCSDIMSIVHMRSSAIARSGMSTSTQPSPAASAGAGSIRTLPEVQRARSSVCRCCHAACCSSIDSVFMHILWRRQSLLWCSPDDGTPSCCRSLRPCCARATQALHGTSDALDAKLLADSSTRHLYQLVQVLFVVLVQIVAVESAPLQRLHGQQDPGAVRRAFAGLLSAAAAAFHLYARAVHTHLVPSTHTERALNLVLSL